MRFPRQAGQGPWMKKTNLSMAEFVLKIEATQQDNGGPMTEDIDQDEELTQEEQEEETQEGGRKERYKLAGERLLIKVKELLKEGNIRRITIKNDEDKVLIEIPLTFGVVGAAFFPVWAAVGAIAALVTDCSIEVERHDTEEEE